MHWKAPSKYRDWQNRIPVLNQVPPIKTYHVLNKVPRREDVWGSGSIAPNILNLGIGWG